MKPLIDVFIIEDDLELRKTIEDFFYSKGLSFRGFKTAEHAIESMIQGQIGCVLVDVNLPNMDGITFVEQLLSKDPYVPILVITGYADIDVALRAVKAGATEFLEKPVSLGVLYSKVMQSLAITKLQRERRLREINIINSVTSLTKREVEIVKLLLLGQSNKEVGIFLDISHRTVEVHRANIMEKLGAKSIIDLVGVEKHL